MENSPTYETVLAMLAKAQSPLRADLAAARADLAGLLLEWMDCAAPRALAFAEPDDYLKALARHRQFFRLKAAACGLPWPLAPGEAGITPPTP